MRAGLHSEPALFAILGASLAARGRNPLEKHGIGFVASITKIFGPSL